MFNSRWHRLEAIKPPKTKRVLPLPPSQPPLRKTSTVEVPKVHLEYIPIVQTQRKVKRPVKNVKKRLRTSSRATTKASATFSRVSSSSVVCVCVCVFLFDSFFLSWPRRTAIGVFQMSFAFAIIPPAVPRFATCRRSTASYDYYLPAGR